MNDGGHIRPSPIGDRPGTVVKVRDTFFVTYEDDEDKLLKQYPVQEGRNPCTLCLDVLFVGSIADMVNFLQKRTVGICCYSNYCKADRCSRLARRHSPTCIKCQQRMLVRDLQ